MMGHREKMKSGDEHDALTKWGKVLKVLNKLDIAAKTKKRFNRRVRTDAKLDAWRKVGEWFLIATMAMRGSKMNGTASMIELGSQ